jgi:molybdopterin converting factor small subunit
MVKIVFSSALTSITRGERERKVDAPTVWKALEKLAEIYGESFKKRIFDSQGKPRRFINLYVNNKDIRFLGGLETKVQENDELLILPAVSGG